MKQPVLMLLIWAALLQAQETHPVVPDPAALSLAPSATSPTEADPINLETGLYVRKNIDLYLPDSIPIRFTRVYRNADLRSRAFGIGASHSFEMFIIGDPNAFTYVELVLADGSRIHYGHVSSGRDFASAVFEHDGAPAEFNQSRISWTGKGWTVALKDGSGYKLRDCSSSSKPAECGMG